MEKDMGKTTQKKYVGKNCVLRLEKQGKKKSEIFFVRRE